MEKTNKKTITIPQETRGIVVEYFKFSEYCKKFGAYPTLRDFMGILEKKKVLETTQDGLYKIKDGVEFVYED